jgi:hypothetical protein
MTAELIVMNKNGLALAADSAVSVSTGGKTTKVYNTANKLFALSKYRPIGVMIYGSVEIMGLPWEVVIKRYREKLADDSFQSLDGYIKDFFDYLKNDAFTPEFYVEYVKQRAVELFNAIASDVDDRVESQIREKGEIEDEEIEMIHAEFISDAYNSFRAAQKKLKIKRADIAESLANHRKVVLDTVNHLLENRPVKGPNKRKLVDACLLVAIVFPGMNKSGLVIAGFGDADVFPCAKAFEINKILDGNIQFFPTYNANVSLNSTVHIKAFAQSNETQNFMNGVSQRIDNFLSNEMEKVLSGAFVEKVTELLIQDGIVQEDKSEECKARLSSAGKGVHAYIKNSVEEISHREFSGPVVSAVAFFSPTEMATMAETLVSLESFKQQVTLRSETVGGPIDVSVITRGDGFIWIKRKHYFAPELNHQFFANYNRSREKANDDQDN